MSYEDPTRDRTFPAILFFSGLALIVFILLLTSCETTWTLRDDLSATDAFTRETRTLLDRTRAQLTIAQGMSAERRAATEATLDAIGSRLDEADDATAALSSRLEPVLGAEDLPTAVQGIGTVLAPFTGPLAPWILLASNALSIALTRRRTRTTTTRHIVAPLEAARNRTQEAALRASNKGNFIVINKDTVAPAHAANGAASLIAKATK